MLFAVTIVIVLFVVIFKWFPFSDVKAWIGFLVSFAICSAVAVVISRGREKKVNNEEIYLACSDAGYI